MHVTFLMNGSLSLLLIFSKILHGVYKPVLQDQMDFEVRGPTLIWGWCWGIISTCSRGEARNFISRQVFLPLFCKAGCHYTVWNWGSGLLGKRALSQLLKFREVMIAISFPFSSAPSALLLWYLVRLRSWNHIIGWSSWVHSAEKWQVA